MDSRYFYIIDSTLDSFRSLEYTCRGEPPKKGEIITLTDIKTKKIKKFKIEFVKISSNIYILKNSNNTIILKRK